MIRLSLTIGSLRVTFFAIEDDDDTYGGAGASSDVTLAPGFVPPTPWYDDED